MRLRKRQEQPGSRIELRINGRPMPAWSLHAGMRIVYTYYRADENLLILSVEDEQARDRDGLD
jgi:hypothetical protein